MSYPIRIHPRALKEYRALDSRVRENIRETIDELGQTFHTNECRLDIKSMKGKSKGEKFFRFRVGNIRVVFELRRI